MLNQRSFSEIFNTLQSENEMENTNQETESFMDPAWITQVIAELGPLDKTTQTIYRHRSNYVKSAKPRPVRIPHLLNEEQLKSFELIQFYQTKGLSQAFNRHELKSAYRMALLKTHPDQGGSAESFQQVRKSYEILLGLVTKES